MKRLIKTSSIALALCTLAGTTAAQVIFSQSDWSGGVPSIPNGGVYVDGEYNLLTPGSSTPNTVLGEATGGNPDSFLRFSTYNTVWTVAVEHSASAYEFNFDYIINVPGNYTRWEVIGVEAGQTVTGLHAQLSYGGIHNTNSANNGPSGGTLLANGDLGGETDGWQFANNIIEAEGDYSSIIFRINRNGIGNETFQAGFDNIVIAIPEPSTYAAFFGVFVLGFVLWRRRAVANR